MKFLAALLLSTTFVHAQPISVDMRALISEYTALDTTKKQRLMAVISEAKLEELLTQRSEDLTCLKNRDCEVRDSAVTRLTENTYLLVDAILKVDPELSKEITGVKEQNGTIYLRDKKSNYFAWTLDQVEGNPTALPKKSAAYSGMKTLFQSTPQPASVKTK